MSAAARRKAPAESGPLPISTAERYRRQQIEWNAIREEMTERRKGGRVAPIEVTKEQIRRMATRGQKRVTLIELAEDA